ncbi:adenylyl-sulfate kinase [Streptomyces sp. DSM 116496]|uniref:adenylyl-sulfate kinase n=1 Tax=Streptomyces stoeckheimensis TaxID=3344656 RepID=UPI0038B245BC
MHPTESSTRHIPDTGLPHEHHLSPQCTCGATVWLTGLPSAGKSTIARLLADRLRDVGRGVHVLDGDEVRREVTTDLGFSRQDREANVRRIGVMAEVLTASGLITLVPVIAPYASSRASVRARHEKQGLAFLEAHVATPVEVCSMRDVKGLYAKQLAGELAGLTGVDDPYETPLAPDIRLHAHTQSPVASTDTLWNLLAEKGLI